MLIETFECDLINTAHVVRATRIKSSEKYENSSDIQRYRFELTNGEHIVGHISEEWAQKMFCQPIPAVPGFFLIWPFFEETTKLYAGYWKTPIIAWAATRFGATPITIEDGDRRGAILCPDGSVEDLDRSFDTVESWESAEREEAEKDAERRRAVA